MRIFVISRYLSVLLLLIFACSKETPKGPGLSETVLLSSNDSAQWNSVIYPAKSGGINESSCGYIASDQNDPNDVLHNGIFRFDANSIPSDQNSICCEVKWIRGGGAITSIPVDLTPYKTARLKFSLFGELNFTPFNQEVWASVVIHMQFCAIGEGGYIYYNRIPANSLTIEEDVDLSLDVCSGSTEVYVDIRVEVSPSCWLSEDHRVENKGFIEIRDLRILGLK